MINFFTDNDLYKYAVQQIVLDQYPEVEATYTFINRGNDDLSKTLDELQYQLDWPHISDAELQFLAQTKCFKGTYLRYLKDYRWNKEQVKINNNGNITITGPWHQTVLWEVPLMAAISEINFWHTKVKDDPEAKIKTKAIQLTGIPFSDFGTRRRFSYEAQNRVVAYMQHQTNFLGTSNVHLALKYNVKPVGTMPHEWIMAHSRLSSLAHANRYALKEWLNYYKGDFNIALSDTYGTNAFFKDFDKSLAVAYDGTRQDSGCPFLYATNMVNHYKSLNIDPSTKTIVFSDSLNTKKAAELYLHCNKLGIKSKFGIGTHLSNDVDGVKPLNMVIKLTKIDGQPVVKLSDDHGKASGDPDAVRVAKWTFFDTPLDPNINYC